MDRFDMYRGGAAERRERFEAESDSLAQSAADAQAAITQWAGPFDGVTYDEDNHRTLWCPGTGICGASLNYLRAGADLDCAAYEGA